MHQGNVRQMKRPFRRVAPWILALLAITACGSPGAEALLSMGPDGDHGPLSLPAAWSPTPSPVPHATPTPAPTPAATRRPRPSATPFMVGPVVIGQSVEGRPLEIFRFGHGPIRRLIVAGIHGGYEWDTIAPGQGVKNPPGETPGVGGDVLPLPPPAPRRRL